MTGCHSCQYKNFQVEQLNSRKFPVFPESISNSNRYLEVVDTLFDDEQIPTYPAYYPQPSTFNNSFSFSPSPFILFSFYSLPIVHSLPRFSLPTPFSINPQTVNPTNPSLRFSPFPHTRSSSSPRHLNPTPSPFPSHLESPRSAVSSPAGPDGARPTNSFSCTLS